MAWPIATFDGVSLLEGVPSNGRLALHAFCRALNEREGAMGIVKTEFFRADGTEGADLELDEFEGISAIGVASHAYQNLIRIRSALSTYINRGYFTKESGESAQWSVAEIEAETGIDFSSTGDISASAEWWQSLKDTFDLLVHVVGRLGWDAASTRSGYRSDLEGSPDDAWSNRTENPFTTGYGPLGWGVSDAQIIEAPYRASVSKTLFLSFASPGRAVGLTLVAPSTGFSGDLVDALATYNYSSTTPAISGVPLVIDGESRTINPYPSGFGTMKIPTPTLSGAFSINANIGDEPSSNPFPSGLPSLGLGSFSLSIAVVLVYFDIASELTDPPST